MRGFFKALFLLAIATVSRAAEIDHVPAMQNPELTHVAVEASANREYMTICPSMCELTNGDVMIVYTRSGHVDWEGGYSSWMRMSQDKGLTWGEARMIADNMQSPGIVQLKSGDVLVNGASHLSDRSTTMRLMRSSDLGQTWTEQQPIWEKSKGMFMQGGCGSLLQLASGRVLCPYFRAEVNYQDGNQAGCFYSDDDGKTWQVGKGLVTLPKRGAEEPSVAELKDGTLIMALRTQLGFIYMSRSDDHGDTWSEAWSSGLETPECPMGMTNFPDGERLLMTYCSGKFDPKHHHSGERTPQGAAVSTDAGKTWRKLPDLAGGPHEFGSSGSNSICFLSNGKVLMAYDWSRLAWDRAIKTGGVRVAIADLSWFDQK